MRLYVGTVLYVPRPWPWARAWASRALHSCTYLCVWSVIGDKLSLLLKIPYKPARKPVAMTPLMHEADEVGTVQQIANRGVRWRSFSPPTNNTCSRLRA